MVHVILQVVAYMRFRKSVKFQWIRGANIYSLIVAPISEVTYVSFILGRILSAYSHLSDAENSITMVGGGYGSPLRGYFGYLNDCCYDK